MRVLFFLFALVLAVAPARCRDRGGPIGVAAGSETSCARFNTRSVCWGDGTYAPFGASDTGVIGNTAGETEAQPEILWASTHPLQYIQTEYRHHCAFFGGTGGGIRCLSSEGWRCGLDTGLAVGTTAPYAASVPFVIFESGAQPVAQVSTGYNHNCALFTNGNIRCWGKKVSGALGIPEGGQPYIGHNTGSESMTLVVPIAFSDTAPATQVSAGAAQTCALFNGDGVDGRIRCWGDWNGVQHNTGSLDYLTFSTTEPAVLIENSYSLHICALFASGGLRCWGSNDYGQLGLNDNVNREAADLATLPFIVFSDTVKVTDVTTGRRHTCAIFANGLGRCWGSRAYYAVGYPGSGTVHPGKNAGDMLTLPYLPFPEPRPAMLSIDAGQDHTCAAFADAQVWCWGRGDDARTGQETTGDRSLVNAFAVKLDPSLAAEALALIAPGCGDGVVDTGATLPEQCDDGNNDSGDGCSVGCQVEPFSLCLAPNEPCTVLNSEQRSLYCGRLLIGDPTLADGTHTVGPTGERGDVWCEREASAAGGVWTNILSKGSGGSDFYTATINAIGDASTPAPETVSGWRKLADRAANLAQLGPWPQQENPLVIVRVKGSLDGGNSWYIRGKLGLYVDTHKGLGLVSRSATFEACRALDLAACDGSWTTHTSKVGTIDTNFWVPQASPDDSTRIFFDSYGHPGPKCHAAGSAGDRCLSSGGGGTTHPVARIDVMPIGAVCGDGVVDPGIEACDDGGIVDGDGCSSTCGVENDWTCSVPEPAVASRCWRNGPVQCGNGVVERDPAVGATSYETCDDGNTAPGDGCSSNCRVEYGYTCTTSAGASPSTCTQITGLSCEHKYRRDSLSGDGVQSGLGLPSDPVSTWCFDAGDGGAFSAVLHFGSGSPTKYAPDSFTGSGDVATLPLTGNNNINKLIDHKVVRLQAPAPHRSEWRLTSNYDSGHVRFFRLRGTFADGSPGWGVTPYTVGIPASAATAEYQICRVPTSGGLAGCSWSPFLMDTSYTIPFDTYPSGSNGCERIFFDREGDTCDDLTGTAERCFSAGSSCAGGHPRITEFTASVRPMCARCGDGCTDPSPGGFETCDDGNTGDGDGCSATCEVEPGWICSAHSEHVSKCLRLSNQLPPGTQEDNGMAATVAATQRLQSCLDVKRIGYGNGATAVDTGLYPLFPVSAGGAVRTVFCDMDTEPDAGGYGAEAGGWARLTTFAAMTDTSGLSQETYDRFFRFALWIDGASHGNPIHPVPSQLTVGAELKVWSHPWREHFVPGRAYELRQECAYANGNNALHIAFDVTPREGVRQYPTNIIDAYNWMAWNQRVIRNDISASFPASAQSEVLRFWLPFTETDGPYSTPNDLVVTQCASMSFTGSSGGCCDCTLSSRRRYGNAGFVDTTDDSQDVGLWLPHPNVENAFSFVILHQTGGPEYYLGASSWPLTCHYWMRPKPVASPPSGGDRTTPLIHFKFNPADFTYTPSGVTVRNHGSMGSAADGTVHTTCTGAATGHTGSGKYGSGFRTDGETCHLRVSDPVAPLNGNHWTIAVWIKRLVVEEGQLVMFRGNSGGSWTAGEGQIKFSMNPPPSGELADEFGLGVNSAGSLQVGSGMTPLDADTWHHYTVVSEGLPGKGKIYIDGVEVSSYHTQSHPKHETLFDRLGSTFNVYIGGFIFKTLGRSNRGLNGIVDDFRWYPYALDAQEIATVMNLSPCRRGECSDGNAIDGDGCSHECLVEPGWDCTGDEGSQTCTPRADATVMSLTCERLFRHDVTLPDGTYTVGPPNERYSAWCERTPSGGAWTNILSKGTGGSVSYTPQPGAIGDASTPAPMSTAGYRKLADRDINLAQLGAWPQESNPRVTMRIYGDLTGNGLDWYVRGRLPLFTDTHRAFGMFEVGQEAEFCQADSVDRCPEWNAAQVPESGFDTWDKGTRPRAQVSPNTDDRLFFDYSDDPSPSCYDNGSPTTGVRCFSRGTGALAHDMVRIDIQPHGSLCGDGVVDPVLEDCDDGGTESGDGCSASCRFEDTTKWECSLPQPDTATKCWRRLVAGNGDPAPVCGNGQLEWRPGQSQSSPSSGEVREECDDGNTNNGDGCSNTCRIEYGYTCESRSGGACTTIHASTCEHLYRRDGLNGDGSRTIGRANDPFSTWCLASGDGGAYSTVMHHGSSSPKEYNVGTGSLGDTSVAPGTGSVVNKLLDVHARVAQGGGPGFRSEWLISNSFDPLGWHWFVRARRPYRDDVRGLGIMPDAFTDHESRQQCRASSVTDCDNNNWWVSVEQEGTGAKSFDLNESHQGVLGNACERVFTDLNNKWCNKMADQTAIRCFTSGQTCPGDHPRVETFVLATRPMCTKCGDGCTDPGGYESCDDGNQADGDGCSATCQVEPGWVCPASTDFSSICTPTSVGNSVANGQPAETCLDHRRAGHTVSGVYAVFPPGSAVGTSNGAVRWVYCDMATDPDPANTVGAEAGGWTAMSVFTTTDEIDILPAWRHHKYFRHALWTEGAARGPPLRPYDAAQLVNGKDYDAWSLNWLEHLVQGRTYEMRQHCNYRDGADAIDLAFDAVFPGHVKQTGNDLDQSWRLRNRRVLQDTTTVTNWLVDTSRDWYFYTPFKETDSPFAGGMVLSGYSSYRFATTAEGCGNCVSEPTRYGSAGIIDDLGDNRDMAFSYLPFMRSNAQQNGLAYIHDAGVSSPYRFDAGTYAWPMTCRYWIRPKPVATPVPGSPRTDPLVRIQFEPSQLIDSGTKVRNLGSLGSSADAQIIGCSGGGNAAISAFGPRGHAITFSGDPSTCRVEISVPDGLRFVGNPWTMSFWFRFSANPSTFASGQILLYRGDSDGAWGKEETMFFLTKTSQGYPGEEAPNTVSFVTHSYQWIAPVAGSTPDDTQWHHYAFTSTGITGESAAYVDGALVSLKNNVFPEKTAFIGAPGKSVETLTLGGVTSSSDLHVASAAGANGEMDDFAWYPHALTQAEIASVMASHDLRGRDDSKCGNRVLDSKHHDCDDGNAVGGDGCDRHCLLEEGFTCENVYFPCVKRGAAPTGGN